MTAAVPAVPFASARALGGARVLRAGWLAMHAPNVTPRLPGRPTREVPGAPLPSAARVLAVIAHPGEAAAMPGVSSVMVADFPDGHLSHCSLTALTERVKRAIDELPPDLLLVIDPKAGSPADAHVARAACMAARTAGLPVAARTTARGREGLRWLVRPAGSRKVPRPRIPRHNSPGQAALQGDSR
jgi:hypothetical protein